MNGEIYIKEELMTNENGEVIPQTEEQIQQQKEAILKAAEEIKALPQMNNNQMEEWFKHQKEELTTTSEMSYQDSESGSNNFRLP